MAIDMNLNMFLMDKLTESKDSEVVDNKVINQIREKVTKHLSKSFSKENWEIILL